jgi:glutaredoxin
MVQSLRDTTPEQIAAAEQWCDTLLSKKILVVVGKSTCPRCIEAVKFLTDLVVQDMCHVVMLDSNSSVPHTTTVEAIQDVLWDRTGCRTVPRIFLRGESLGGYDDVLALHDENLLIPTLGASTVTGLVSADGEEEEEEEEEGEGEGEGDGNSEAKVSVDVQRRRFDNNMAIVRVTYKSKCETVYILASLTGLQLKSKIIAELGLQGGFGDYYLLCNGLPFGSRTPIINHEGFVKDNNSELILEDRAGRQKAIGHT